MFKDTTTTITTSTTTILLLTNDIISVSFKYTNQNLLSLGIRQQDFINIIIIIHRLF